MFCFPATANDTSISLFGHQNCPSLKTGWITYRNIGASPIIPSWTKGKKNQTLFRIGRILFSGETRETRDPGHLSPTLQTTKMDHRSLI